MSGRIEGKIVGFSDSGDLLTDITADQLKYAPRDEHVRILCDEHETVGIFEANHGQPDATFLALLNAQGSLELRIVGMSARELLGIPLGERILVQW